MLTLFKRKLLKAKISKTVGAFWLLTILAFLFLNQKINNQYFWIVEERSMDFMYKLSTISNYTPQKSFSLLKELQLAKEEIGGKFLVKPNDILFNDKNRWYSFQKIVVLFTPGIFNTISNNDLQRLKKLIDPFFEDILSRIAIINFIDSSLSKSLELITFSNTANILLHSNIQLRKVDIFDLINSKKFKKNDQLKIESFFKNQFLANKDLVRFYRIKIPWYIIFGLSCLLSYTFVLFYTAQNYALSK